MFQNILQPPPVIHVTNSAVRQSCASIHAPLGDPGLWPGNLSFDVDAGISGRATVPRERFELPQSVQGDFPTPEHLVTDRGHQSGLRLAVNGTPPSALRIRGPLLHDPLHAVSCNPKRSFNGMG